MNEIVTELSKPIWWVSVVMAGIVINLLSAYLKSPLDRGVESTFSWWRKRSEVRQMAWQDRIERIIHNEEARNDEVASEFRFRIQSIQFLLLAIFLLAFISFSIISGGAAPRFLRIIILGFSAALFFVSFLEFLSAAITASALRTARKNLTLRSSGTAQKRAAP